MKNIRRALFVVLTISMMCEELLLGNDSVAGVGWYLQQDLKSWTPIPLAFNLIEVALIIIGVAAWMARPKPGRREKEAAARFLRGRFTRPLLVLAGALALGVLWGMIRPSGGLVGLALDDTQNWNYALFEVRGLGVMIYAYFLVGLILRDEGDLSRLVWCVLIACTWLVLDDSLRSLLILKPANIKDLAYSYDHVDAVVLVFGAILCLALLAFGGTRAQRRYALVLLPGIVVTLQLMERRAAFAILAAGVLVMVVVLYRLRPKLFWRVVPATAIIIGLYLAVFWNTPGTLGQPARAVSSLFTPDPRDTISNLYRMNEHTDLVYNINSSPVLGLGFGRPYSFYVPLDVLKSWPFWPYETHDAVLWLWMDGGLPTFFAFWWVMGAGLYWGGQELSRRREGMTEARAEAITGEPAEADGGTRRGTGRRARVTAAPATAAAEVRTVSESRPTARRTPSRRMVVRRLLRQGLPLLSGTEGAALALVVAGVCQIVMQVAYSYVDLGLISGRDMLLVGVLLGVVGRTFAPAAAKRVRRTGAAAARVTSAPTRRSAGPGRGAAEPSTEPAAAEPVGAQSGATHGSATVRASHAAHAPMPATASRTGGLGRSGNASPHVYASEGRERAGPIVPRSGG